MKVFRQILHATDFSSASRPAFAKAIALARQNRAALRVVHALPPLILPAGGDFGFVPAETYDAIDQRARQQAQKQLAALVARARKAGVRATALLLDGLPHEQVPPRSPPSARRLDRDRDPRADGSIEDPRRERRRAPRAPRPRPVLTVRGR